MITCKYCQLPISPEEAYALLFKVGWYHCMGHADQYGEALKKMLQVTLESLKANSPDGDGKIQL